jgi:uncharacterized lipoprotein
MMNLQRVGLLLGALFALAGCHSLHAFKDKPCNKPAAYTQAQSIPPLKIPTGLDAPDNHGALKIPQLNEPEPPPRNPRDPCLDEPPSYTTPKAPKPPPAA